MSAPLILASVLLTSLSGGAALALRRRPEVGQRFATALLVTGALLGIAGALIALGGPTPSLAFRWSTPGGALSIRVDALSALFLLPILGVPALGSVYGLGYWPQATRGASSIRLQIYFGLVTGAMALVCVSANAILFLAAWEVMALAGFLLVLTEHERPDVQRAAFVYLAAAHVGNLALFALFALLGRLAGSFEFAAMAGLPAGAAASGWIFALALCGFGLKAGLVPLHFWLPGAHAAAPSHVSALMSGVLLKTGIYGILRVTGFFDAPPPAWGATLLAAGAASAVLGVGFALAQHDLKRLLAYHSVENIGIIAMGAGLALLGRTYAQPALVVLGFSGAVLHVVNHATFKGLLFLGAGAVHHATGTREIDHLGGLSRAMPVTAALFLVGATAISGLPPLNGFASEWLVYLGAMQATLAPAASPLQLALIAVPALALVGGLAAACFAKVFGAVFLGHARSGHVAHAHEPPPAMIAPMGVLAAVCVLIGLLPVAVLPALSAAAAEWARLPPDVVTDLAAGGVRSAARISGVAATLLLAVGAVLLWRRARLRGPQPAAPTWGCGFARPTARMQYTGSSFADSLVLRFGWVFFPKTRVVIPAGPFPRHASFDSSVPDTVLDVVIVPAAGRGARFAERVRAHFIGRVQFQALLVVLGLLTLLGWYAVW
ncbi:MAG TPA: proton-conducting transporter membrane subunit [Anaeromyxobacteraceae bacterium]|nr:proton-conducting transporter membrane subunit [Anaeromyxobacteraceae bacterium]